MNLRHIAWRGEEIMSDIPDTIFHFTLPLDLFEQAADILEAQGLTVEKALALFFEYVVATGSLPFSWPIETTPD